MKVTMISKILAVIVLFVLGVCWALGLREDNE
jgi:hypothetical protein